MVFRPAVSGRIEIRIQGHCHLRSQRCRSFLSRGRSRAHVARAFSRSAFRPAFLRLVWETHRGYAVATVALRLLRAGIPVATLWVAKLIIDTVVSARMGRPNISQLWFLVGLELLIVFAGEVLDKASTAVEGLFGDLCSIT